MIFIQIDWRAYGVLVPKIALSINIYIYPFKVNIQPNKVAYIMDPGTYFMKMVSKCSSF